MPYIDRTVTGALGKQSLASLLPGVWPAFWSLQLTFPASNVGRVGVGDSSMAALPPTSFGPNEGPAALPNAAPPNPWAAGEIYLWFENANDTVVVRGQTAM